MVDLARRSPSARLYSLVPRSSQCPSMRTRLLALDFSHAALPSRIFASSARTSYRSKSKNTSLRLVFSENSLGRGGVPGGEVAAPPGPGAAGASADGPGATGAPGDGAAAPGAGAMADPVGAGADATGVAGRLGQPTRNSVKTSRGMTASKEPRR